MFEKINQLAEHAATNVSRRQFLRRFGRGAAVAALAAGTLLVFARDASAARHPPRGGCPKGYHPCKSQGCCP